jgi:hypothetical protein
MVFIGAYVVGTFLIIAAVAIAIAVSRTEPAHAAAVVLPPVAGVVIINANIAACVAVLAGCTNRVVVLAS